MTSTGVQMLIWEMLLEIIFPLSTSIADMSVLWVPNPSKCQHPVGYEQSLFNIEIGISLVVFFIRVPRRLKGPLLRFMFTSSLWGSPGGTSHALWQLGGALSGSCLHGTTPRPRTALQLHCLSWVCASRPPWGSHHPLWSLLSLWALLHKQPWQDLSRDGHSPLHHSWTLCLPSQQRPSVFLLPFGGSSSLLCPSVFKGASQ